MSNATTALNDYTVHTEANSNQTAERCESVLKRLLYATFTTIINAHLKYAQNDLMRNTFSTQAPKKATNLSLNSELLAEAKRLNINLSATMEKALEKEVSSRLKAEWLEKNAEAIEAYNELTEKHGLFSDSYRVF